MTRYLVTIIDIQTTDPTGDIRLPVVPWLWLARLLGNLGADLMGRSWDFEIVEVTTHPRAA